MALADTSKAIGAVTETLKSRIATFSQIPDVSIGRPDENKTMSGTGGARINLFLYEIHLDEHLKNTPLNEGDKPPLWLVLKYLVTAFHGNDSSNNVDAHKHLGAAMRAIATDGLVKLDGLTGDPFKALSPNPEELHVTFDDAPSDLLAKLMQGTDEQLRISFCFQVRPVMIAAAEPGNYSLLVGVNYTDPPKLTDPYVGLDVIPSMGARIDEISPVGFEVNDVQPEEVTIYGTDLNLSGLSVMLGPVELPVTMQRPDELRFRIDPAIIAASGISAGSYPITVVQALPGTGKTRKSNSVIGNLVPTLSTAAAIPVTVIHHPPPGPDTAFGTIGLAGKMLGGNDDDTVLALFRNGVVHRMFDEFVPIPSSPPPGQLSRVLVMPASGDVEVGTYRVILMVNGQQAPQSPEIDLV
jgi:hypothetical protein